MVNPFNQGMLNNACPMADIFSTLNEQMAELKMLKESSNFEMAPAWASFSYHSDFPRSPTYTTATAAFMRFKGLSLMCCTVPHPVPTPTYLPSILLLTEPWRWNLHCLVTFLFLQRTEQWVEWSWTNSWLLLWLVGVLCFFALWFDGIGISEATSTMVWDIT